MYLAKLKATDVERLSKIDVPGEAEPFDSRAAYEQIKTATDGFRKSDAEAVEADNLLHEILTKTGFYASDDQAIAQPAAVQDNNKSDKAKDKEVLEARVAIFQKMLKRATPEDKAILETRIASFQRMIKRLS